MIKFSILSFYIFAHNRSFLGILANFNLLRTLELMFFGPSCKAYEESKELHSPEKLTAQWTKISIHLVHVLSTQRPTTLVHYTTRKCCRTSMPLYVFEFHSYVCIRIYSYVRMLIVCIHMFLAVVVRCVSHNLEKNLKYANYRCCCVLGQEFYSHSACPTQVYKWVPANWMLGVTLRWTSIPSRGE